MLASAMLRAPFLLACIASISVGLSAGLKLFLLFEHAKIGASTKKSKLLPSVLHSPQFSSCQKANMPWNRWKNLQKCLLPFCRMINFFSSEKKCYHACNQLNIVSFLVFIVYKCSLLLLLLLLFIIIIIIIYYYYYYYYYYYIIITIPPSCLISIMTSFVVLLVKAFSSFLWVTFNLATNHFTWSCSFISSV